MAESIRNSIRVTDILSNGALSRADKIKEIMQQTGLNPTRCEGIIDGWLGLNSKLNEDAYHAGRSIGVNLHGVYVTSNVPDDVTS